MFNSDITNKTKKRRVFGSISMCAALIFSFFMSVFIVSNAKSYKEEDISLKITNYHKEKYPQSYGSEPLFCLHPSDPISDELKAKCEKTVSAPGVGSIYNCCVSSGAEDFIVLVDDTPLTDTTAFSFYSYAGYPYYPNGNKQGVQDGWRLSNNEIEMYFFFDTIISHVGYDDIACISEPMAQKLLNIDERNVSLYETLLGRVINYKTLNNDYRLIIRNVVKDYKYPKTIIPAFMHSRILVFITTSPTSLCHRRCRGRLPAWCSGRCRRMRMQGF